MLRRKFRVLLLAASVAIGSVSLAAAHSWYPQECCNDMDCAPVESIKRLVPAGGGPAQLVVTSKVGTAIIYDGFPIRESKDGRMHVCMRQDYGTMHVICVFIPPSM